MVHPTKYPNLHHYSFTLLPHLLPYNIYRYSLPLTSSDLTRDVTHVPLSAIQKSITVLKSCAYSRSDTKKGYIRIPKYSANHTILHFMTPRKLKLHQQFYSFPSLERLIKPTPPLILNIKIIIHQSQKPEHILYFT